MIITILMARNVYEQDDHYQSGAKKWSGFGLTNRIVPPALHVCHRKSTLGIQASTGTRGLEVERDLREAMTTISGDPAVCP